MVGGGDNAVVAGDGVDAGIGCNLFGCDFVAHGDYGGGGWANECHGFVGGCVDCGCDAVGECCVFGEESVALRV